MTDCDFLIPNSLVTVPFLFKEKYFLKIYLHSLKYYTRIYSTSMLALFTYAAVPPDYFITFSL